LVGRKSAAQGADVFKSDERILGDSNFVDEVLSAADEQLKSKYALKAAGVDLNSLVVVVARLMHIELAEVFAAGKERRKGEARSLLCCWTITELGFPMTELSRRLDLFLAAVSMSVSRGERIAKDNQISLVDELKLKKKGVP
jgi:hypothetical protein